MFIPIIKEIQHSYSMGNEFQHRTAIIKRVAVTCSVAVLLGLSWVFGVFAIGDLRIPFQWLFTIFNSLTGFLIFAFHVIRNSEAKREWKTFIGSLKTCSKPVDTDAEGIQLQSPNRKTDNIGTVQGAR